MDFGLGDRLHFEDVGRFKALDITGRKGDAIIKFDGGKLKLDDVDHHELDAGDFLFG